MESKSSIILGMLCACLVVAAALWLRDGADPPAPQPPALSECVAAVDELPDTAELRRLQSRIAELEAMVERLASVPAQPETERSSTPPGASAGSPPQLQPELQSDAETPVQPDPTSAPAGTSRQVAKDALQRLAAGLNAEALESPELWQLLTRLHLLAGDPEAAMASLAESFRRDPSAEFFGEQVAGIPADVRLAGLQDLLADFPDHDELWGDLADTYRDLENPEQAFASYSRAFEADPRDSEWSERLVELDPLQAANLLERSLGAAVDDDELLGNLADAYRGSARESDALETYRRAHEIDPNDKEWLRRITELRPAEGIDALQTAIANEPGDHEIWNLLGSAYRQIGDRTAAADAYLEALDRRPRDGDAIAGLGAADPERALDWLAPRHAEAPDNDEIWGDMGDAHLNAGRTGEALRCYQQAAALDPDDGEWPPKIAELSGD